MLKCAGFAKAWTQPAAGMLVRHDKWRQAAPSPVIHPPLVPADRQRLWLEVMSLVCAVAVDVGLGIAAGAVLLRHADGIAAEAGNVCLWLQVGCGYQPAPAGRTVT